MELRRVDKCGFLAPARGGPIQKADGSSRRIASFYLDNLDPQDATQRFLRDQPQGPETTARGAMSLCDKFPVPAVDPPQPTIDNRLFGPVLDDVIHSCPR